jgi:dephospho-CoA kinase
LIVIGLTGGIATGKSTASAALSALGARVWDADQVARTIVEPGKPCALAIREAFGGGYFDAEGNLLRDKLAKRIFDDGQARKTLESLTHPAILQDMGAFLQQCREENTEVAVIDAPLLLETGIDRECDTVWVLSCGVDEQMNRLMARDLSYQESEKRINAQMSDRERRSKATRVIDTSGTVEDTRRHITALYEEALDGEL